ncbi:MAG: hypothetical protein ACYDH8_02785 [Syntrophales bacterium]
MSGAGRDGTDGVQGADCAHGADRAHGADGRIFYLHHDSDLRCIFAALGFDVLDFSRDVSRIGTGEIWLGYLLKKTAA